MPRGASVQQAARQRLPAEVEAVHRPRRCARHRCIDHDQPVDVLPRGDERWIDHACFDHGDVRQFAGAQGTRNQQPGAVIPAPGVADAEHEGLRDLLG